MRVAKSFQTTAALNCAVRAARASGQIMRENFHSKKKIDSATQHDIKLELDVRCQKRIEAILQRGFPQIPILGEEGVTGDANAPYRWVVDPIDGTVNFTYGIPHACVSIALQGPASAKKTQRSSRLGETPTGDGGYETLAGAVYDPFCNELWTAIRGQPARLNGRLIRVSQRKELAEAIISIGFAKEASTMQKMLPAFNQLVHRVRKMRIMGSAALSMVYVASGRMDGYVEYGLRLWDIAAGGLILECAGGDFFRRPLPGDYSYEIVANNGKLRETLQSFVSPNSAT